MLARLKGRLAICTVCMSGMCHLQGSPQQAGTWAALSPREMPRERQQVCSQWVLCCGLQSAPQSIAAGQFELPAAEMAGADFGLDQAPQAFGRSSHTSKDLAEGRCRLFKAQQESSVSTLAF